MNTEASLRKERADVIRNRAKILHAAEVHFGSSGVGASLEAVARAAGVGPATLYRHFPTREALLAALLRIHRDRLLARQRELDELSDAGEALRGWLLGLEEYFGLFQGISEPLVAAARSGDTDHPLAGSCQELISATDRYLTSAQRDGRARPDLDGLDLFIAVSAVSWIAGTGTADTASVAKLRTLFEFGYLTE
ncbi:TetR/AcrR family transcriptional regulator [Nocardia sp. NPDC050378]|uniref:TetR/AcrR family transcriptional regulator n=1 Tax=Nocardia sp. NPDC050378 TaxID=3155400 RepID=UPI0033D89A14